MSEHTTLTAAQRSERNDEIRRHALAYAVVRVEVAEIDTLNIYQAGLTAMRRAIDALGETPEHVLVDGVSKYRVWCDHCKVWHFHGAMEEHRIAHCTDQASPYWKTGYNLALASDGSN